VLKRNIAPHPASFPKWRQGFVLVLHERCLSSPFVSSSGNNIPHFLYNLSEAKNALFKKNHQPQFQETEKIICSVGKEAFSPIFSNYQILSNPLIDNFQKEEYKLTRFAGGAEPAENSRNGQSG
jgi:hypothetical protein